MQHTLYMNYVYELRWYCSLSLSITTTSMGIRILMCSHNMQVTLCQKQNIELLDMRQ